MDFNDECEFMSEEHEKELALLDNIEKGNLVCPHWAVPYWRPQACKIEQIGKLYAVIDEDIQVDIFYGTKEQCKSFLRLSLKQ